MYQYLVHITLVLNSPGNVWRRATQSIASKALWFSDQRFSQIVQWTGRLGTHVTFVLAINIENIRKINRDLLLNTFTSPRMNMQASRHTQPTAAENNHLCSLAVTPESWTRLYYIPDGERPQPPPKRCRRIHRVWPRRPLEDWLGDYRRWGRASVGKWGCWRPECQLGRSSALPRSCSSGLLGEETPAAC